MFNNQGTRRTPAGDPNHPENHQDPMKKIMHGQRRSLLHLLLLFAILLLAGLLTRCASVKTEGADIDASASQIQPYPLWEGEKERVRILELKVPSGLAEGYPQLADQNVGWGLMNRIIDELYQTGRFQLVEDKADIRQKLVQQWAMAQSGLVMSGSQEEETPQGLSAPQYFLYAELADFSVHKQEQVSGLMAEEKQKTSLMLQLRLVDVKTGEFIPASGTGSALTTGKGIWVNPDLSFDQSAVGLALNRAVNQAVHSLLKRKRN